MRHNFTTLAGSALTLLLVGAASSAQADTIIAQDNASYAVYNGGSFNGLNGGTGFGAWSVNSPNGGSFIGNSTNNGGVPSGGINSTGGKAFGIYSNGAQTTATRPLTTPLAIGQTLSLDFDNGYINSSGPSAGFYLSNGGNNPLTVYFNGGDSQYRVVDNTTTNGLKHKFHGWRTPRRVYPENCHNLHLHIIAVDRQRRLYPERNFACRRHQQCFVFQQQRGRRKQIRCLR